MRITDRTLTRRTAAPRLTAAPTLVAALAALTLAALTLGCATTGSAPPYNPDADPWAVTLHPELAAGAWLEAESCIVAAGVAPLRIVTGATIQTERLDGPNVWLTVTRRTLPPPDGRVLLYFDGSAGNFLYVARGVNVARACAAQVRAWAAHAARFGDPTP